MASPCAEGVAFDLGGHAPRRVPSGWRCRHALASRAPALRGANATVLLSRHAGSRAKGGGAGPITRRIYAWLCLGALYRIPYTRASTRCAHTCCSQCSSVPEWRMGNVATSGLAGIQSLGRLRCGSTDPFGVDPLGGAAGASGTHRGEVAALMAGAVPPALARAARAGLGVAQACRTPSCCWRATGARRRPYPCTTRTDGGGHGRCGAFLGHVGRELAVNWPGRRGTGRHAPSGSSQMGRPHGPTYRPGRCAARGGARATPRARRSGATPEALPESEADDAPSGA